MAAEKTKILSTHKYRRVARVKERWIQWRLNNGQIPAGVPSWARGVRVENAGDAQFAVVATSTKNR